MIPYRWLSQSPHLSDLQGTGFVVPRSSSSGEIVARSLHEAQRAEEIQGLREAKHAGTERRAAVKRVRHHYGTYRMPGILRAHREPFAL